jgi:hypothetical protein
MKTGDNLGFIALSLLGSLGCSTVLMNRPSSQRADDWTVTVTEVTEGPNTYPTGGITYRPGSDESFIWASVTIRNELNAARTFSYDACDLDSGSQTYLPVLVDRDTMIHALTDKVESFDPGESRGRRLIFSYPEDSRPTRMRCGPMTIPIPNAR